MVMTYRILFECGVKTDGDLRKRVFLNVVFSVCSGWTQSASVQTSRTRFMLVTGSWRSMEPRSRTFLWTR